MDDMSWNDYVASKRIVIISRLLGIAIALVGFLFVGDLLGEAQTWAFTSCRSRAEPWMGCGGSTSRRGHGGANGPRR